MICLRCCSALSEEADNPRCHSVTTLKTARFNDGRMVKNHGNPLCRARERHSVRTFDRSTQTKEHGHDAGGQQVSKQAQRRRHGAETGEAF